jgi:methyl-accepting chemotaxis protein
MNMPRHITFGQRIAAGFGVSVALTIAVGAVGAIALASVSASKDRVIDGPAHQLIEAERLRVAAEKKVTAGRTYMLTGDQRHINEMLQARDQFRAIRERLSRSVEAGEARDLLTEVARAEENHHKVVDDVTALRRGGASLAEVVRAFDERAVPARDALDRAITAFITVVDRELVTSKDAATAHASTAIAIVVILGTITALLAAVTSLLLGRNLSRQIGTAVAQVQTSSAELEAVATQQASGAREEATAMSEITTTINELLATSRQIADSAQKVAEIATQTAGAANAGDSTIEQANGSILAIRHQVDQIVGHMLELGEKSQQIGAVLEIVSELAEQTNILAINATIEATGAGDSGRRFAVVADEIRKLSDRVADSAKEIRRFIDDVRAAVNTTVMATETGSKAVDTGSRQFSQVALSFEQIANLVATTSEAAREIELSTKQQTTAVEQVNVAVVDVAQATRATEAGSTQTQQTASQLAALSRDLLRLVHAKNGHAA